MHKTLGMGGRRFHQLPRHSAFGFRRSSEAGGGARYWRAAKRALQYLWRTKDVGITYGGTPGSCTKLWAWVDADFTTCPDIRRSVSGGAVKLGVGRDQFVLEDAEGDRGCIIRNRVCGAGRSCK